MSSMDTAHSPLAHRQGCYIIRGNALGDSHRAARKDTIMTELYVQPQGYSSTDAARPPLPDDSPKLQQWADLKGKLGQQLQVRTFVGYAPDPQYTDVRGKLVDVLLVPTSPPVYRWLHDEMWTVKVRLQKDDGSTSALVIDRTTQVEFVG